MYIPPYRSPYNKAGQLQKDKYLSGNELLLLLRGIILPVNLNTEELSQ